MSAMVAQLQSSLLESDAIGSFSDCGQSVPIELGANQTHLLKLFNRACFGVVDKGKHAVELGLEEAIYLCHALECLRIESDDVSLPNDKELWHHMKSRNENFTCVFKAYSHLRMKNWVVKSGARYGVKSVDFVACRHHPALIHSEYVVLVSSADDDDDDDDNAQYGTLVRAWPDFQGVTWLCGSKAKTLLVPHINKNSSGDESVSCLERYTVDERIITRWTLKKCHQFYGTDNFGEFVEYIILFSFGLLAAQFSELIFKKLF